MKKCFSRSAVCRVRMKLRSQQIGDCWRQTARRFDQRAEAQPPVPDKSAVNVGSVGGGRTTGGPAENEQERLCFRCSVTNDANAALIKHTTCNLRERPGMEVSSTSNTISMDVGQNAVQRVSKK